MANNKNLKQAKAGDKFGRWTLLRFIHPNKTASAIWLCACDCGTKQEVPLGRLRAGHSKSCGCIRRGAITGKNFGRLTALEPTKRVTGGWLWRCLCACGNEKDVLRAHLSSGGTRSCGCINAERDWKEFSTSRLLPTGVAALNALYACYKTDAKRRSRWYEFQLSVEEFKKLTSQNCHYCGAAPSNVQRQKSGDYVYNGVDRQNNEVGYVLENCVPCCRKCNIAKHEMGVGEFADWVKRVSKNLEFWNH